MFQYFSATLYYDTVYFSNSREGELTSAVESLCASHPLNKPLTVYSLMCMMYVLVHILTYMYCNSHMPCPQRGHEPCVRVWDISSDRPTQVVQLKGHNFGVACVVSDNSKMVMFNVLISTLETLASCTNNERFPPGVELSYAVDDERAL